MLRVKIFIFSFLLFALCGLPYAGFVFAETPSPFDGDNLANSQAPDFTLKDSEGKTVTLSSYRGTVVLLNFWATWCPSCREEMPSMNKLSRQFKKKKFTILAVSTDRSVSDVKHFLQRYPMEFPVLIDEGLTVSRSRYKVFVLPMSFLIDKNGTIVEKYFGSEDWTSPEMVRKLDALIGK